MKTFNENFQTIISDLKNRGEKNIRFMDNGIIVSNHGKYTVNYWIIDQNNDLRCIDCKTIY